MAVRLYAYAQQKKSKIACERTGKGIYCKGMGKFEGKKQEYHDIYSEFNGTSERMIQHTERSGASGSSSAAAAAAVSSVGLATVGGALMAVAAVTGIVSLAVVNLVSLIRPGTVTPTLKTVTRDSAQVEVVSDLTEADIE